MTNVDRKNILVADLNFEPKSFIKESYIFSISIVKSAGFKLFPQVLHFPS